MPQLEVLVCGAGIAGSTTAFLLSKAGHSVTVIERHPTLRTDGLQLDLRGHGIDILERMGLDEAFRAVACPETGFQVVDSTGRCRAFFPVKKPWKGVQSFTSEWEIMRGDFVKILFEAASAAGVEYRFGLCIEELEHCAGGRVRVIFDNDGKAEDYDMLVGADGQHSHTRKLMLGLSLPTTPNPSHVNNKVDMSLESDRNHDADPFQLLPTGEYIAYFTIPRPISAGEEYRATLYMSTRNRGVMTRRSNDQELQVYLGGSGGNEPLHPMSKVRRGDIKAEKTAIREVMQGAGWNIDDLISEENMGTSKNFYCERIGIVKMEKWSGAEGKVVLVGDAAYCPSVNTGMGTTSAIVGAYILAGEIDKNTRGGKDLEDRGAPLQIALEQYEAIFRPFMDSVQAGLGTPKNRFGMLWDSFTGTAVGVEVMNWVSSALSFLGIDIGQFMMREVVKGWALPEYPAFG